ncbi:MAG TPA: hypothetical protein EYP56_11450 [Planctomycetaceae bacterium]|nr:hypothetical protein [Planctomycetaceae bacterium]HIQ23190.1 hypothetical protein [Planctomycetota bacterium]
MTDPWLGRLFGVALLTAAGLPLAAAGDGDAHAGSKTSAALAAGPCCAALAFPGCGRWCPDDYDSKPLPYFCLPPLCGHCDDYRPKPLPCFSLPGTCGSCDDYRSKPCPHVAWPSCFPAWYRCPAPSCAGGQPW